MNKAGFAGDGIIIFHDVADAMKGETTLRLAGYEARLIAPPPEMRMGCDLALEVNLVEKPGIERAFAEQKTNYTKIMPLAVDTSSLCEVLKVTDFGRWYMVKSGNMKLSFEKTTGIIVNISGGGCPDIPYLAAEMTDKILTRSPQPRDLGYTLCATMLQRAYEEAVILFKGAS